MVSHDRRVLTRHRARVAVAVAGVVVVAAAALGILWLTDQRDTAPAPSAAPVASPTVATGNSGNPVETLPPDATVPAFSGPYAARFESAYRQSTSQSQRDVLEDGAVTEQEMSALRDDVVACLTDAGVDTAGFDGATIFFGDPTMADDALIELAGDCQERGFGQVDILFGSIGTDPENVGEAAQVVPCLQRAGLVPSTYSADDYERDMASGSAPFDPADSQYLQCLANPNGGT